jgi:uncharacterized membrane protein
VCEVRDDDQVRPRRRRARPVDTGHGHGHGHGPAAPASTRVRRILLILLLPCLAATVVGALWLYPWGHSQRTGSAIGLTQVPVNAEVTELAEGPCADQGVQVGNQPPPTDPNAKKCQLVTVRMTDGDASGQSVQLRTPIEPSSPHFSLNDKVVLAYSGSNPGQPGSYTLADFQRGFPLTALAVLFGVAVLVLGRWQGVKALAALGLSVLVLALFVLPAVLAGENPLVVAVVGSGLIMFVVLYLTHGLSARTSTAVLGTLASLALIGALGAGFSALCRLTGLDDETANLITILGHGVDARGLLLAGMMIGALGVLDDVTVTQTSAVWELRRANTALSWRDLYAAGLRIGRDHISSAVNTLVMAYAGASLPVLLAFAVSGRSLDQVLSAQNVAQEVVRTLVGSIGLVASVPITTALAALVASQERVPAADALPAVPVEQPASAPAAGEPGDDADPDAAAASTRTRRVARRPDPSDAPDGPDSPVSGRPRRPADTGPQPRPGDPGAHPRPGDTGGWDDLTGQPVPAGPGARPRPGDTGSQRRPGDPRRQPIDTGTQQWRNGDSGPQQWRNGSGWRPSDTGPQRTGRPSDTGPQRIGNGSGWRPADTGSQGRPGEAGPQQWRNGDGWRPSDTGPQPTQTGPQRRPPAPPRRTRTPQADPATWADPRATPTGPGPSATSPDPRATSPDPRITGPDPRATGRLDPAPRATPRTGPNPGTGPNPVLGAAPRRGTPGNPTRGARWAYPDDPDEPPARPAPRPGRHAEPPA